MFRKIWFVFSLKYFSVSCSERYAYCLMDTVRTSINFPNVTALLGCVDFVCDAETQKKFKYEVIALKNGAL